MAEFDDFAEEYERRIDDPLRRLFGGSGSDFFDQQKLNVLIEFCRARSICPHSIDWLDVGCGNGKLLRLGKHNFATAVGCEPSIAMLRAGTGGIIHPQKSPTQLPFGNATFGLVTLCCVLHHVELADRKDLLRDVFRVLRPGGYVCAVEHNPLNPVTRYIVSRSKVDRTASLLAAISTRHLLRATGWQNPVTRYFLFFPKVLFKQAGTLEKGLRWCPFGGQYAVFAQKAPGSGDKWPLSSGQTTLTDPGQIPER